MCFSESSLQQSGNVVSRHLLQAEYQQVKLAAASNQLHQIFIRHLQNAYSNTILIIRNIIFYPICIIKHGPKLINYIYIYIHTCPFMFQVTMQMQRSEFLEKLQWLSTSTVSIPSWVMTWLLIAESICFLFNLSPLLHISSQRIYLSIYLYIKQKQNTRIYRSWKQSKLLADCLIRT